MTVEAEAETMTFAGATVGGGTSKGEVEEAMLVVDAEARPVLQTELACGVRHPRKYSGTYDRTRHALVTTAPMSSVVVFVRT